MTMTVHQLRRLERCAWCGGQARMESFKPFDWFVSCDGCYDGAPDAGPQNTVHVTGVANPADAWNEKQRDERAS